MSAVIQVKSHEKVEGVSQLARHIKNFPFPCKSIYSGTRATGKPRKHVGFLGIKELPFQGSRIDSAWVCMC